MLIGSASLLRSITSIRGAGRTITPRRKLKATHVERTVLGEGDGSDFFERETPLGRIVALCCWEYLNPLNKYAMFAQNEQIHIGAWHGFRFMQARPSLPDNLCLIRPGQDYRHCGPNELAVYQDTVRPTLMAGMNYLHNNPDDTNCLSCGLMDELALDSSYAAQSFGLAIFASLHDLEAWAKRHPTHLRIFESFFRVVAQRNGQLDLSLWHEVLILDRQNSLCEYVNCHPNTCMLPWFGRHGQVG